MTPKCGGGGSEFQLRWFTMKAAPSIMTLKWNKHSEFVLTYAASIKRKL